MLAPHQPHHQHSTFTSDDISERQSTPDTVKDLKKQLREKDMVLTDIRLEALSSAHQLEGLKETVNRMRVSQAFYLNPLNAFFVLFLVFKLISFDSVDRMKCSLSNKTTNVFSAKQNNNQIRRPPIRQSSVVLHIDPRLTNHLLLPVTFPLING
jgi:hypothetical protein